MKQLFVLSVLFYTALCHADTTLVFKHYPDKDSSQISTYYIKDGILRLSDQGSKKISLYDKSKQLYQSFDGEDGTISRIDRNILKQNIDRLNQQRLAKLAETEKQLHAELEGMDGEAKRLAESLVNQLKYPEFYGAHTFLKVEKTAQKQTINNIECQIYNIRRQDQLLRQICMAEASTLGISQPDYQTLRDFYHFNYTTQTQIMLAMGNSDFSHIDYEEENVSGIPIESRLVSGSGNSIDLSIVSVSTNAIDAGLMQIPNSE